MGKSPSKTTVLPVIPLPVPLVLLPGTTLRIPITNRADIAAILAKIYSVSATVRPDAAIAIACVPLSSSQLSKTGRLLIEDGKKKNGKNGKEGFEDGEVGERDPMNVSGEELFGYGCLGKVTGVQGRGQGDLVLVVEGLERCVLERVVQERPYFEAVVGGVGDEGMHIIGPSHFP